MDRSTTFRSRLKEHDPGRYKEYLEKQRIRAKERREHLKKELQKKTPSPAAKQKKEHELQLQRERQRKWLAKKKAETMPSINIRKSVRKLCVETRHSKQHKREYNREKKREERANQSYQKKMWIRKKDNVD
ncbi:coiled-coil domain-containing protein 34-like [Mya arenaria]|uniref:coiled-coil domain-containing protein 34-like n=1 Tax=Mya arenaria TaxID=6604 RepID=UPI0022E5B356|nr:coiled-coil domain-containing protein 34-like [Mya arenaria]